MAPSPRRFLFPDPSCIWNSDCMSPSPPPPPPDSIPIAVHHKSKLLSNFLIAAAAFLVLSFLLFLFFYFLLRVRRRNRRLLRAQQQQQQQQQDQALHPHADDLFLDVGDDQDDGGPHHVWFIRTVGLDESVIKSIAATVYKSGDGLIDGGDCPVCLGEFRDGEVIKLLPKCTHAFHLSCIDTWLRSHVNCPLCRAPVVAPPASGPAEEIVEFGSVQSEITQIEVQPLPNQEECAIAFDLTAGSSSSSGPLEEEKEEEVQPIRRSVSMDSSSLARLMLRMDLESEEKLGEERKEIELREFAISKKGGKGVDFPGKQPAAVEMKRSLSSRSGRFFFSRYVRGRSASILPL